MTVTLGLILVQAPQAAQQEEAVFALEVQMGGDGKGKGI